MAFFAVSRSVAVPSMPAAGLSMPMNHCVVARKMIGVLCRQQCG